MLSILKRFRRHPGSSIESCWMPDGLRVHDLKTVPGSPLDQAQQAAKTAATAAASPVSSATTAVDQAAPRVIPDDAPLDEIDNEA